MIAIHYSFSCTSCDKFHFLSSHTKGDVVVCIYTIPTHALRTSTHTHVGGALCTRYDTSALASHDTSGYTSALSAYSSQLLPLALSLFSLLFQPLR